MGQYQSMQMNEGWALSPGLRDPFSALQSFSLANIQEGLDAYEVRCCPGNRLSLRLPRFLLDMRPAPTRKSTCYICTWAIQHPRPGQKERDEQKGAIRKGEAMTE